MRLRTIPATLLMTAALSGLPPSLLAMQGASRGATQPAQTAPVQRPETFVDRQSAHETRGRLHELLGNYPPALTQVLRLDPSLLSNADYLAPYPGLGTFLQQHPDVARNPSFYLGEIRFASESTHREQTINALEEILAGIGFFIFFMAALAIFSSASRSLLEHRRWQHAVKVQTEAHTKLVDRLASNEDLLAYMQSAAGQRFLSATALTAEPDSRLATTPAPIGRILGSVQLGVVAMCAGLGLWTARFHVIEEVAQPLSVLAILGVALGLGFVLSALVAYVMSKQMGLIRSTSHA